MTPYPDRCWSLLYKSRTSPTGQSTEKEVVGTTDEEIELLMENVKKFKKRIAGKSLQMEKLAVARADRYLRGGKLILPALEMIYLWNGFGCVIINIFYFCHINGQIYS